MKLLKSTATIRTSMLIAFTLMTSRRAMAMVLAMVMVMVTAKRSGKVMAELAMMAKMRP